MYGIKLTDIKKGSREWLKATGSNNIIAWANKQEARANIFTLIKNNKFIKNARVSKIR